MKSKSRIRDDYKTMDEVIDYLKSFGIKEKGFTDG